jgi:hypothetical protein
MIVKEGAFLPVACGGPQKYELRSMKIYHNRESAFLMSKSQKPLFNIFLASNKSTAV